MEQLAILEKICDNMSSSMVPGTAMYIFTASIYDTWSNGNELEKNLARRLVGLWEKEFTGIINECYKKTKYQENKMEYNQFCKNWINENYLIHNNFGIKKAIRNIWENKYGTRLWY